MTISSGSDVSMLAQHMHDVTPSDEQEVIRDWLRVEQSKPGSPEFQIEADLKENEQLARLLAHKPDAARGLFRLNFSWNRCQLSTDALGEIYMVWRSPDERRSVSEIISNLWKGESELSSDKQKRIREVADEPLEEFGPLIIGYLRRPFRKGSPYLIDGNHRALALYRRQTDGEDIGRLPAYIGYSGLWGQKTALLRRRGHRVLSHFG